jgi:hypothetical protein
MGYMDSKTVRKGENGCMIKVVAVWLVTMGLMVWIAKGGKQC